MTTLTPRPPYTSEELQSLYPASLELQQVQILLRHGERSPVSARFQNTGLPAFWPYCNAVRHLKSAVLDRPSPSSPSSSANPRHFTTLEWKRRLETFGDRDNGPVLATGPGGELDGVCEPGMLTDRGRETTLELGARLRRLYVEQLRFLPPVLGDADAAGLYLRATPIPRALDSVQETFTGLYPASARGAAFPPPAILNRAPGDETLFPNDSNCRRFAALSRAFAHRAAERWNATDEMAYLSKLYGKWMPEGSAGRVAVDSRPRLSGIMDTINATLAHGPETRLPKEFYDAKGREIVEKIGVEEWFAGYKESKEYRMLGIGGLMGDVVGRMVGSAEHSPAAGRGATPIRFGLSGCHDTTLAAVLSSLGAFERNEWPPFTSHIAIEMFRKGETPNPTGTSAIPPIEDGNSSASASAKPSWFSSLFGTKSGNPPPGIGHKRTDELTANEKAKLEGYFVRLRYNDEVVSVPGCKPTGKHLEGDESFCTLAAFKAIVDKYAPHDWKQQCRANVNAPAFPEKPEPAGY
ncbi:phosphoglycerate mutase-like protein [Whalleya microplaca]|nr:phosphoglycerate mutase-like protein [Whalleya microplaca]